MSVDRRNLLKLRNAERRLAGGTGCAIEVRLAREGALAVLRIAFCEAAIRVAGARKREGARRGKRAASGRCGGRRGRALLRISLLLLRVALLRVPLLLLRVALLRIPLLRITLLRLAVAWLPGLHIRGRVWLVCRIVLLAGDNRGRNGEENEHCTGGCSHKNPPIWTAPTQRLRRGWPLELSGAGNDVNDPFFDTLARDHATARRAHRPRLYRLHTRRTAELGRLNGEPRGRTASPPFGLFHYLIHTFNRGRCSLFRRGSGNVAANA